MTSFDPPATVSLSDPGDLIAATPALLGFVPRSSLVAMALGGASGRRLGLTLRIDLPPPEHIAAAAENVVNSILLDHPVTVVVIVIGPGGDAGPPAIEFVQHVTAGLAAHAVDACHALWSESTAAGSRWQCYGECACTGLVAPASTSPLTAAARAEGRVVRADRSELERLVAPVDERVLRRREALLDAAVDAEADATFAAFTDCDPAPTPATARPAAPAAFASGAVVPGAPTPATAVLGAPTSSTSATAPPATAGATSADPAGISSAGFDPARSDRAGSAAVSPAAVSPAAVSPAASAAPTAVTSAGAAGGAEAPGADASAVGPSGAGRRRAAERAAGERWIDPRTEVIEGIAALDAALDAAHEAVLTARAGATGADRAAEVTGALDNVDLAGGSPTAGGDEWLDDELVVALTRALQVPLVRDAAVAACTGSRPAAAEALWAALARGTPDPEAAEPAALLALMGLLQGDGALANVALQRAEAAWPGHHLTATLRGLAAAGIRPSELRACLTGDPAAQPSQRGSPHRGPHRSKPTSRRRRRAPRPTRRRRRNR
jgi:Domain of unknown function (DUF4192)